jgi:hypothetical protein
LVGNAGVLLAAVAADALGIEVQAAVVGVGFEFCSHWRVVQMHCTGVLAAARLGVGFQAAVLLAGGFQFLQLLAPSADAL